MIHELRIYSFWPGMAPQYLKLVETVGIPARGDSCGIRIGSWMTDIGALNQVWHLWHYDSLDERQRLRAELGANRAWMEEFVPQIKPLLKSQEVRFLNTVLPVTPPAEPGNIYEARDYQAKPGEAAAFAGLLRDTMPVREKYSKNVGLWTVESGEANGVFHLWAYRDMNTRTAARAGAMADPGWQAFLKKGGPLLQDMRSLILIPVSFSGLQ